MFARRFAVLIALLVASCGRSSTTDRAEPPTPAPAPSAPAPASSGIPSIEPADLAAQLDTAQPRPLLFQVGFKKLYEQAHIPGSEYFGPGNDEAAIGRLRDRVTSLPRDTPIVVYCGCCPWERCPNVKPAYALLHELGFTRAKVLSIPNNFGDDWAAKGYPVASGM
ncbi:MAG: rhodanese-like domain-containing protein [Deltaproteobacteria bacterium]|nr:rhodanese-like domain-containing protein [Deltaproteobacteria bacterium]